MFSKMHLAILHHSRNHLRISRCFNGVIGVRLKSTVVEEETVGNEKLFLAADVQNILKKLTHFNADVVFEPRPVPSLRSPRYLLMTDDELHMARQRAHERGRKLLEMVPFKNPRKQIVDILEENKDLIGFEASNFVFTDISPGASDRNRLIVVREPNGVLRRANHEERHRMNQIYFPVDGRFIHTPKMFEEIELDKILGRGDYKFILESATTQFEPDDPEYLRVTQRTFEAILQTKSFDALRSTRHFGTMTFYYCIHNKIDELLVDMVQRELLTDGALLVQLYFTIHPSKALTKMDKDSDYLQVIKSYVAISKKRHILEIAIQAHEELERQRKELENVDKATASN